MRKPILLASASLFLFCVAVRSETSQLPTSSKTDICQCLLRNSDPRVQIAGIDILDKLGVKADDAVSCLNEHLTTLTKTVNSDSKDKDKNNLLRVHIAKALGDIASKANEEKALLALKALAEAKGSDPDVNQAADAAILLITQAISKPSKTPSPAPAPAPTPPCPPPVLPATIDSLIAVLGDKAVDVNVRILVVKNISTLASPFTKEQKSKWNDSVKGVINDPNADNYLKTVALELSKLLVPPEKTGM